ncbi:MAG: hypothetical protein O3C60_04195 [Planctomycetota bacterium]|nr:hypothetical protein [Planctomycetota bacterium]
MALVHELSHVSRMPTSSSDATQSRSDLTRIAKSTEYGSIQEFAFAFANTLKTKLDCEQVSLGIARGSSIQLLCISGSDVLYPHAPGAAVIVHAMQECLDAQQVVCFQLENERGKGGGILGIACIVSGMKRWHRPAWPAYRWFSMVVAWLYWDCVGEGATIF